MKQKNTFSLEIQTLIKFKICFDDYSSSSPGEALRENSPRTNFTPSAPRWLGNHWLLDFYVAHECTLWHTHTHTHVRSEDHVRENVRGIKWTIKDSPRRTRDFQLDHSRRRRRTTLSDPHGLVEAIRKVLVARKPYRFEFRVPEHLQISSARRRLVKTLYYHFARVCYPGEEGRRVCVYVFTFKNRRFERVAYFIFYFFF